MKPDFCLIIPCYRHGRALAAVLERLEQYALPTIVVDDGNTKEERQQIETACRPYPEIILLRNRQNLGKGAAFCTGLRQAQRLHYTHAVQLDADGQHCVEDLPKLLKLARARPEHLISACPVYDDSVPKIRYYGRYLTHLWVWIETLSFKLEDSMCGYRIYPVDRTLAVCERHHIGAGMDFDTTIMVHLYWEGVDVDFLPSRVTYPQDGISNFRGFKDNLRISLMHTRLCIYLLTHLPRILNRRKRRSSHWAAQRELHGLWGMRLMLLLVRVGGRRLFSLLLYPVIACYYLSAGKAREASRHYLKRIESYAMEQGLVLPVRLSGFRHFYSFAQSMLDKILAWQGQLRLGREVLYTAGSEETLTGNTQGGILLGSHLGTLEAIRAVNHFKRCQVVNALVFTEHAARFKQIMDETAPDSNLNIIAVPSLNLTTVEMLQRKIARGEYIAILGDRIPVQEGRGGYRVNWISFLGHKAPFPQGPFILAALLKCPVLLLHALREQSHLMIYCKRFATEVVLDRQHKQASLERYQRAYAQALEELCLTHPLEWFNFYDFWSLPESSEGTKQHAPN